MRSERIDEAERRFGAERAMARPALYELSGGLPLVHRAAEAGPGFRRSSGAERDTADRFTAGAWQLPAAGMCLPGNPEEVKAETRTVGGGSVRIPAATSVRRRGSR
jgi:hypothetical protein